MKKLILLLAFMSFSAVADCDQLHKDFNAALDRAPVKAVIRLSPDELVHFGKWVGDDIGKYESAANAINELVNIAKELKRIDCNVKQKAP